ncbi:MAG TPA: SRPBCC family protein [Solirubrobacteraceae bacterium]|nr:SRPBCC family protein [Solirubrobacteraceae bacterium]
MPTTRRSRVLEAPPDRVWRVLGDPHHLPRWWPKVRRVEAVSGDRFTQVMRTEKGKDVRADFRIVEEEPPRLLRFEQELEGTPFEGFLSESATAIEAEPSGDGTKVTIAVRHKLRGVSRLGGGTMLKRATKKQLDEALSALEGIV